MLLLGCMLFQKNHSPLVSSQQAAGWSTVRETVCHFQERADHQAGTLPNCGLEFGLLLLGPEEQRHIRLKTFAN